MKHHNPAVVSDDGSVDLVAVALEDVKAFFTHVSMKCVNVTEYFPSQFYK